MPRTIPNDDNLFRHSIYPVSFRGKRFAQEKLLRLEEETAGSLVTSLAWERYAPTAQYVHEYGCRLAVRRNKQKRDEGKYKEKDRQIYCGVYQLTGGAVRSLANQGRPLDEIVRADVVHEVEYGEIAHINLRVRLKSDHKDVEGTKTAIIDRLWNVCRGPVQHVCYEERDLPTHPNVELSVPPAGGYVDRVDRRPYITRLWHIVRFKAYLLLRPKGIS